MEASTCTGDKDDKKHGTEVKPRGGGEGAAPVT